MAPAPSKRESKAARERKIFKHFLNSIALPSDEKLIESRNEPEPDIAYLSPEGIVAFELVEICSSDVACARSKLARNDLSAAYVRPGDPTFTILRKKLQKTYKEQFPMQLLCYSNGRLGSPDERVCKHIEASAKYIHSNPFQVIWYMGKKGTYQIWARKPQP